MSSDVSNLKDTIIPKSDQLNADQLLGAPMTIEVTSVKRGSTDDQPISIGYVGDNGRPWKPCKSMRKVLIFAWGEDGSQWVGRMATLYNKGDVKFGGIAVGGIRISHLSHIPADIALSVNSTRGKKEPVMVKRLDASDPVQASRVKMDAAARGGMESLKQAWASLPADHKRAIGGADGCPASYKTIAQQADAKPEPEPAPEPKPEPQQPAPDPNF
jgi:hypothetical protein